MTREERAREVLAEYLDFADDTLIDAIAAMLAFADAEAAAMRERAAECADKHVAMGYMSGRERDYCHQHGDEIAELIRALPVSEK